ncbi:retron St85 family RNA-directed DNA polymerase [Cardiobacterium sp. Marseille-Q4385]|jgi:RNA-directed DNA polymerase|uniref:retron St85 family RNA-directed DNA polymerase n=1 Tax=Cardiobacterium sp. Marseille-Q4385 TaxID=2866573 RepID=UPI001CE45D0B|nr:retron St85 family RNA-directed DNA polymerase [Cardiobacterium sp. Marseille-Q4385]
MSLLQELSDKFQLHEQLMESFIKSAPYRYKFHKIDKRHGGKREIAQPVKSLKIVQRWLVKHYLSKYPTHSKSAIAYIKNKNIKDFAEPHRNNIFLLKLDFKDFFNSIKISDFYIFCEKLSIPEEDKIFLGLLLFCKNKQDEPYLSIGAPSSPTLSNVLMFNFDNEVFNLCKKDGIIYTRYADDLAFSTNQPNVLRQLLSNIKELCAKLNYPRNLQINTQKTIFTSKKYNRTLTGLVISNDGNVGIGREKKRKLRAIAHQAKLGRLSQDKVGSLLGKIAFLKGIDPSFAKQLEDKYLKHIS